MIGKRKQSKEERKHKERIGCALWNIEIYLEILVQEKRLSIEDFTKIIDILCPEEANR